MRESAAVGVASAVVVGVVLFAAARPSTATYENARAVGRACASCHSSTHPGPNDLNETGRYFLVQRELPEPALAGLQVSAPPGAAGGPPKVAAASAVSPGAQIFERACAVCHGEDGEGTATGTSLTSDLEHGDQATEVAAVVRKGVPGTAMFAFERLLTASEIEAVASHVAGLRGRRQSPASTSSPPAGATVRKEDP